jgi:hypothetical protein
MSKVNKINKPVELDLAEHIDEETGEVTIYAKVDHGVKIKAVEETGLKSITSEDYAVLDSNAMTALMSVLNNSDLANVLKMSIVTKTSFNIVYNNNTPHNNTTLMKYLEIKSEAMYMKLIKRLIAAGVLYQIKGNIYGSVRVCYMLNPFLSRKRKVFEEQVFEVFKKFSE